MDYGVTHVRLYLITPISLEEKWVLSFP
jgi:hypothetical protein